MASEGDAGGGDLLVVAAHVIPEDGEEELWPGDLAQAEPVCDGVIELLFVLDQGQALLLGEGSVMKHRAEGDQQGLASVSMVDLTTFTILNIGFCWVFSCAYPWDVHKVELHANSIPVLYYYTKH